MNLYYEAVNNILASWNPIGVEENIAMSEYLSYVPSVIRVIGDQQKLRSCLEDILTKKLGLEYDADNAEHVSDLQYVCSQLMKVYSAHNKT